jgi:polar amino acid transport system substrate-binding protein
LLTAIRKRGTLVIATDPANPPQSNLVAHARRANDTRCGADQLTVREFNGFEVDLAVAIASQLGVEPCFVTPDWALVTEGGWDGRWDIALDSIGITKSEMKGLYFSQPYAAIPVALFVEKNASFGAFSDLSGRNIGLCTRCPYGAYLSGIPPFPGEKADSGLQHLHLKSYDADTLAFNDLLAGQLDGVLTTQPTGAAVIASGKPVRQLGDPVFVVLIAPAVDRRSIADPHSLVARVTEIVRALHSDGTLKTLSEQYYHTDQTAAAATFNIETLK